MSRPSGDSSGDDRPVGDDAKTSGLTGPIGVRCSTSVGVPLSSLRYRMPSPCRVQLGDVSR
jgi:hypothetical protein